MATGRFHAIAELGLPKIRLEKNGGPATVFQITYQSQMFESRSKLADL